MASTTSTACSSHQHEPPPVPFDPEYYNPTPCNCLCPDRKMAIQLVSWTPKNPVRRYTVCPNRYKNPNDSYKLFEWNDPEIPSHFQKVTLLQLKAKVTSLVNQIVSLEAQVAQMDELLKWKDASITNLQAEVVKKVEKVKTVEKVKKKVVKNGCCFPNSLVVFSFVVFLIACWCSLKLNDS
ncbi:hypothetical protein SORBI_3002G170740 [Sorghum bicolor]|uniref:Zinc finger GRF-type domain-containing protein n=1 Tax=Sorghum bicolor TaxID=4558 RepID=A0A1W0W4N4_SORBI|nr:hypothetical protein SORBI_3002G170740 [Sorghum bicolor]